MKITRAPGLSIASCLAFLAAVAVVGPIAALGAAPIPEVTGPIPVTADSYPFGAANRTTVPQDLSRSGYVEEEYFMTLWAAISRPPRGSAFRIDARTRGNLRCSELQSQAEELTPRRICTTIVQWG
jgi:hypothetical protein